MVFTGKTVKGRGHCSSNSTYSDQNSNNVIKGTCSTHRCTDFVHLDFLTLAIAMPYSSVFTKYCEGLRIVVHLSNLCNHSSAGMSQLKVKSVAIVKLKTKKSTDVLYVQELHFP